MNADRAPQLIARTVDLPGPLSDEAWDWLVADLRETFQATGEVRHDGSLRQWRNGNLHALIEPIESGHRLHLRTLNGNARSALLGGLAFFAMNLASKRFLNRSKLGRSRAWKSSLYSAISVGVIIFFFLRNSPTIGLLLGLVVAGIVILIYPQLEKNGLEGRLRRVVAEMMPDSGPYVCEVEIRSEGVWLRQMNKQVIHEWQSVEAIEETFDSVDTFTRDGAGVVIRSRAFGSEGERRQFIEIARSRLMESRS